MKPVKIILFISVIIFSDQCLAQTNSINITNAGNKTTTFTLADLQSFPQTTLNVAGEDGVMHNYTGFDLYAVLSKAGVAFGKDVRKQTINSYMLIKAADNYSVVYALAEVDSFFQPRKYWWLLRKDDNPLPANFGPLQIIATDEKRHARLIRMVTDINIIKVQ
jgi:hypothetical protein